MFGYTILLPLSTFYDLKVASLALRRRVPMLAEHSDDVLERMQVLRESQLVLVSGTREPAGVAPTRSSLQVFIGESSLRIIDHRTTQRSGTKRLVDRFLRRKDFRDIPDRSIPESVNSQLA